jgi:TolB-like protein/cytochrome c-type biogenesis protein CcmH/NrfG
MSTFGAHPKEFELKQVKPVLLNLTSVLEWYLKYTESLETIEVKPETAKEERRMQVRYRRKSSTLNKRIILISSVLLVCTIVVVGLIVFDIGGIIQNRSKPIESILILPFHNYTGDETLDATLDGVHSSLINEVQRLSGLRVINKTSSDAFMNAGMTIHEIASKMNVSAVIESNVLCWGDSICMNQTIINGGPDEEQLWKGDYREEKSNLFNMYNQVTKQIAGELNIGLTGNEKRFLGEYKKVNPKAIDAYLIGRHYLDQISEESLPIAIEYFNKAIEIEPDWAAPYAGITEVGSYQKQMGFGMESNILNMMYKNLYKALDLDPNCVESHYTIAMTAAWTEHDWKKAEEEFLTAIKLNPSYVRAHIFYAHVLTIQRRTDEALEQGKTAIQLDPENPLTLGLYAYVLMNSGKCREALSCLEKALYIQPDNFFASSTMMDAYECLGDYDKTFESWKMLNYPLWEEYGVAELFEKVYHEHGWIAVTEEAIRVNEEVWAKDGHLHPIPQAFKYLTVGKYDRAMDYFETAFENNNFDPNLPYISVKPVYDKMKNNPRYLELLKKMNLPVTKSD